MVTEPAEAISSVENAIRLVVRTVLGESWMSLVSESTLRRIEKYKNNDAGKRAGVSVGSDLLAYTEFPELIGIVLADYDSFRAVFGDDQLRTQASFRALTDLRNAVAHSRELVTFEREILSGTATQVRNQVQNYRTQTDPANAHYPLIESAVDGWGDPPAYHYTGSAGVRVRRLDVGERLTFRLRAIDQRNRPLLWRVRHLQGSAEPAAGPDPSITDAAKGSPVELEHIVTDDDVGEDFRFVIWLLHGGERFHRRNGFDDKIVFCYAVNPPLD